MKFTRPNLLPGIFFVIGSALVVFLTMARQQVEAERLALERRVTSEQISLRIQTCINDREALINTLSAFQWTYEEQLQQDWQQRAGLLFGLHPGLLALNFVDTDRIIRNVYPVNPNLAALGADLNRNPNPSVIRALALAENSDEITRTDIVELLQTGKGLVIYRQINSATGQLLGFVNGVFRVADLIDSCLQETSPGNRFVLSLAELGGTVFYQQPAAELQLAEEYTLIEQLLVAGRPWVMSFSPSREYLESLESWLDFMWPCWVLA